MAMLKWFIVLFLLMDTVQRNFAQTKKCVNTPFDLVIASQDTGEVIPATVTEINRVYSAIATEMDIGGQHRMAYYTMTRNAVNKNFGLPDHTTVPAITAAIGAVADQDGVNGNAQIPQGLTAIKTELDTNGRAGIPRYGLVLDASNFINNDLTTAASTNINDGTIMHAIGIGPPLNDIDRAVSAIVNAPASDRYKRALSLRDFNFFRDDALENPTIRLLCPGDIGGRCGRGTVCDKAANTRCVRGTCVCNARLQNTNGICVTGPVLGEACNIEECSVLNSECSPLRVCQCMEGYIPIGTTGCKKNSSGDGTLNDGDRAVGILVATLPFILTSVNLLNPSTLVAIA